MVFSLQIARKLVTSSCLMGRRLVKHANPGVGHQLSAIDEAVEIITGDPEGFEDLESNLLNAHQSHKDHELELKFQQERIRLNLVKNKYFRKDPYPNLLTYAEKQHIRFLKSSGEEEWTVEKLAESFPANSEIILKILKSNWSPLSANRIISHDTAVSKNWERFKNGEYDKTMPSELIEHLKKFSHRREDDTKISENAAKIFVKKQWKKPCSNEFLSIVSPLKKKSNCNERIAMLETKQKFEKVNVDDLDSETYLRGPIKNKTPITIHELKSIHLDKSGKELENTHNQVTILNPMAPRKSESSHTEVVGKITNFTPPYGNIADYTEKFVLGEISISEYDRKRFGILPEKKRIHIPRKLWRKGATYRANDCYYDYDGEFLYKVPGMTLQ